MKEAADHHEDIIILGLLSDKLVGAEEKGGEIIA